MGKDKSLSNMAKHIMDITLSKANLYPTGVARLFGYIEFLIDRGFSESLPAEAVIDQIEEVIGDIRNILAYPSIEIEILRHRQRMIEYKDKPGDSE